MKFVLMFIAGVGIYSASPMAVAATNLYCDQLKLNPRFFQAQAQTPALSWTEEGEYFKPADREITYQLQIIDDLLAYQNERMAGCEGVRPRTLDRLYQHPRVQATETLRITVAVGYYDRVSSPYVMSSYLYNVFIAQLTKPCQSSWNGNCGFSTERYDSNTTILSKKIWEGKTLEIQIFQPAQSTNDRENRKGPNQEDLSEQAEQAFHESFSDSQFVFYMGHSRNGGGPDFSPAKLDANGSPDYQWYNRTKIKKTAMTDALKEIPKDERPLVFGILGCSSKLHFHNRLREVLPEAGLFLSKDEIYMTEFFQGILTFINGLQFKKSSEEMNIDLDAVNIAHRMNGSREASLLFLAFPPQRP